MKNRRKLLAAIVLASSSIAHSEFSVTQDYDVTAFYYFDRPIAIEEDGMALSSPVFPNSPDSSSTTVVRIPNLSGLDETLDYMEAVIDGDDTTLRSLPDGTSASDARLLFENYPEPATSQIPIDIMIEMEVDDPSDPDQYLDYISLLLHELLVSGHEVLSDNTSEEIVGSSASHFYFSVAQLAERESTIYRCSKETYQPVAPVISQVATACDVLATDVTHAPAENSVLSVNLYDYLAIEDNAFQEPTRVFNQGSLVAEIEHAIDYTEDGADGINYRAIVALGDHPLVAVVMGGLADTVGTNYNETATILEDAKAREAIAQFNSEIYYIHEDGFAEQLTFPAEYSFLREFNDTHMVTQRYYYDEIGEPAVDIEICKYELDLRYDPGAVNQPGSQANLGGQMTCAEVVEVIPGYHQVVLGYDPEVYAASLSAVEGNEIATGNDYGMPVYLKNMRTGERLGLADAYRELRIKEGLEDLYSEARQTEILEKTLAENGTPQDNLDEDSNVIPGLYAGLLENYPLPPDNPEYYKIWPDISSDDFQSLIKHLKNYLVITDAFEGDSDELGSIDFLHRSRLVFKFTSPTTLLSGLGRFTFTNSVPYTISGNISKQYLSSTDGVRVTLQDSADDKTVVIPDANSAYAFTDLEAGTFTLFAQADNFVHECATITLSEGNRAAVEDIMLLAGDLNNDGRIGPQDLAQFRLRARNPGVNYDLNNDGVVDDVDLQVIRDNLGAAQCDI
jgi:hypothetical protein